MSRYHATWVRHASSPFRILLAAWLVALAGLANDAWGQYRGSHSHSFMNARLPVGELGRLALYKRPELNGVMQPVLVRVPRGATVAVAEGAGFSYGDVDATLVSLEVGRAYRLKVSNVPNYAGDVYPTIELIDRLHPPPGKEKRYPIPIALTEEELGMALRGKYVTRVIYVEDPRRALAVRELPDDQRYFEVMSHEDPLRVAQKLGRPVAILRMGSLAPSTSGPSAEFLFNSPPVHRHAMLTHQVPYVPRKLDPSELPAKPEKREELPDTPLPPEVEKAQIDIPEQLPAKSDVPDEPANDDLFDGAGEVEDLETDDGLGTDDDGADNPFGEPETDDGIADDDPFGDLDDSTGDEELPGDDSSDDDLGGGLFDDI